MLRWLRPPRTLRPTRAGWIFFVLTFGVAFAALNSGNNLLYLMLSLMLAFLCLSGVFSEAALRGIEVRRRLPAEIVVGRPAAVELEVINRQQRVTAFAIAIEDRVREAVLDTPERAAGRVFVLRVGARSRQYGSYRLVAGRRGDLRFTGFRVSTRFPFGLFQKSRTLEVPGRALVFPALVQGAPAADRTSAPESGDAMGARASEGGEVGGLREFVEGDSARRIQWRASVRRGSLVVRDTERREDAEVEIRLHTRAARAGARFERAVSRAASQVAAAFEAGSRVGLRTDDVQLPAEAGGRQRARLLAFLARVEAGPAPAKEA